MHHRQTSSCFDALEWAEGKKASAGGSRSRCGARRKQQDKWVKDIYLDLVLPESQSRLCFSEELGQKRETKVQI